MQGFEKLKQNYEFRRAYTRGNPFVSPFFVLYCVKGKKDKIRLGITVSRKLGSAVCRNRAKRIITAAFRANLPILTPGYDYVIVARTRILSVKSTELAEQLRKFLNKG